MSSLLPWRPVAFYTGLPSHEPYRKRFLITRHGERPDGIFGKGPEGYVSRAFDENDSYTGRFDMNLPAYMYKRADNKGAWSKDPNLTEIGFRQAQLCGRALCFCQVRLDYIISSPSLRCVRTAKGMADGYNIGRQDVPVVPAYDKGFGLDPGLFEFPYFAKAEKGLPTFLTNEAFAKEYAIKVDVTYTPSMNASSLSLEENLEQFYARQFNFIKHAASLNMPEGSTILLTTHAPNFEPLVRQITGRPPRPWDEFKMPMRQTPFLAMLTLLERPNGEWEVMPAPIPILKHNPVVPFDFDGYLKVNVP